MLIFARSSNGPKRGMNKPFAPRRVRRRMGRVHRVARATRRAGAHQSSARARIPQAGRYRRPAWIPYRATRGLGRGLSQNGPDGATLMNYESTLAASAPYDQLAENV